MSVFSHLLSILTFLMTLAFVTVLLRSRRSPSSTIAWLGAIVLAPYLGIPLFLALGARKFGFGSRNRSVRPAVPHQNPGRKTRIARILRAAGAPEARVNRAVDFLETGESAYSKLIDAIRGARERIGVSTFILSDDLTGRSILQELTARASQGLEVRLLLDAWGSPPWKRPGLAEFVQAGGKVAFSGPLLHSPLRGRTNLRNHRKLGIFDDSSAWFGGMNLADEYMGPSASPKRWIDLSIWLEGQAACDLGAIFDADWRYARGAEANPRIAELGPSPVGEVSSGLGAGLTAELSAEPAAREGAGALAQAVASGPDTPSDSIYDALLEACFVANSRIWIVTPYFVPDELLTKALELAARRGVDVRIAVPAHSNHGFADLCRGSYLRQLALAGAKALLHPKMVHAKMVLVDDDFCLVGSANFDLRSLLYNYEVGVFLYGPSEIARASAWAGSLLSCSAPWSPRPGFARDLGEGMGRMLGPLF